MSIYPKIPYAACRDTTVLQEDRCRDKRVKVKPDLPGNVIVIHGVNDVGTSYDQVEKGLCAGLNDRLGWRDLFCAADYRMPGEADKGRLEDDPDAVFFKRSHDPEKHHTPVIPFYWGYREISEKKGEKAGQLIDRYGNRLDKDLSKGGGPFSNATNNIPDMWNRGFGGGPGNFLDSVKGDPLRPVLTAPGRLYMILAASRLACLISMIRDYEANDTVSVVAHSQGCLVSLLAQALLVERGLRPADTLVLTNPPYSLSENGSISKLMRSFKGGSDVLMEGRYGHIKHAQSLHSRLQTLVNIVLGVHDSKHAEPVFTALADPVYRSVVGAKWCSADDRDNRGKVYLYFCPEDMTVALDTIRGIGWCGVPDLVDCPATAQPGGPPAARRRPLSEMAGAFFQRVFTARRRPPRGRLKAPPEPVLVGAPPPYDFPVRLDSEEDYDHVALGEADMRASSPPVKWPPDDRTSPYMSEWDRRLGVRTINGEALMAPVSADMYAGAVTLADQAPGTHEAVDPIDAAISVTSNAGLRTLRARQIDNPLPSADIRYDPVFGERDRRKLEEKLNEGKAAGDKVQVLSAVSTGPGKVAVELKETPNQARLRQQNALTPRSFHSAVFGSAQNHRRVTAFDVAIGSGKAASDPAFYRYLCAVADWRLSLSDNNKPKRLGISTWQNFLEEFSRYLAVELDWRRQLISGNCQYYSTGALPESIPLLPDGLPELVVSGH